MEFLYAEISEKEVDTDASLRSTQLLLTEALSFIRDRYDPAATTHAPNFLPTFEEALGYLEDIASRSKSENDPALYSESVYMAGRIHEARFDFVAALSCYDRALMNASRSHKYVFAAAIVSRKMCDTRLALRYLDAILSSGGARLNALLYCRALNERGALYEEDFDLVPAVRCLLEAKGIADTLDGQDVLRHRIINNIAHCFTSNNDPRGALPYAFDAYEYFRMNRHSNRPDYASVSQNFAETLRKCFEVEHRGGSPLVSEIRHEIILPSECRRAEELCDKYMRDGLDEAEFILRECLAFCRSSYKRFSAHPALANALNNLGAFVSTQHRDFAEGADLIREAVQMMESMFTEHNPRLVPMLMNLGVIEGMTNPRAGIQKLRRAASLAKRVFPPGDPIFEALREETERLERMRH